MKSHCNLRHAQYAVAIRIDVIKSILEALGLLVEEQEWAHTQDAPDRDPQRTRRNVDHSAGIICCLLFVAFCLLIADC